MKDLIILTSQLETGQKEEHSLSYLKADAFLPKGHY